ncbi:MAG: FAD-linked oxidase [Chloroflexi bacterium HGW-Chloroflexi-6]|nr:MAG: FAD-linked oxidase [Chloroflexi bacterium HGW-Chloroflexi-6]
MKVKSNPTAQIVPSISELRALFNGRVIAPDDPRYEQARAVFYGGIDRHPAAIVRVVDAGDVSRLVSVAREAEIELAIRSGGHSNAGHSTIEGGIVLDLSAMKDLQINVQDKTAWAEAGLTAGEYVSQTAAYGLTTGFGDTGTVGLGGITLGGGVGYLVRKHGLTIDNLLAAEVVTAAGELLHVDDQNHPDLFWAIRGGGGNFGVATRFKFQLHNVNTILGGMLCLPATADTIASFIAEAESAPDELSAIVNVMTAPPMPFLPADVHGKLIIMAMLVYAGDNEVGDQFIAKFRSIAIPYADMIRPIPYTEMFPPEEGGYHPIAAGRTMFVDQVTHAEAEMILNRLQRSTGSMAVTQLRVLGGAMSRVPADATAFAHRKARIMVNLAALYENPDEKEIHEAWVTEFAAALHQSDNGAYINFLANVDEAQVRAAYPNGTWERLAAIKARYDPDNFFHLNQNIPPQK